jgi:Rieske Fe-S protein
MQHDEHSDCPDCPLAEAASSRRDFLRDLVGAAGVALVAAGLTPALARALPVSFGSALAASGGKRTYPIPALEGVTIDKDESVIIARAGNVIYAFSLACPHQNTALKWDQGQHRFQCPKHKSKYRPDGVYLEGRATRSMDRFPIVREGNNIVVDLDDMLREDKEKAAWEKALVSL